MKIMMCVLPLAVEDSVVTKYRPYMSPPLLQQVSCPMLKG